MSPSAIQAFTARLAEDDGFRALVVDDPRSALAEYGLPDEPGLVPEAVVLPSTAELAALGLERGAEPRPPEPPRPEPRPPRPSPITVQMFDPS